MKVFSFLSLAVVLAVTQLEASEIKQEQTVTKLENRKSIIVKKTDFKKYFTGGEVRIDPVYPKSDTKMHSGAYVTFEPGARSKWHTHPRGQHIIVTSGVGYTQTWGGKKTIIKPGDVVWCPPGVKHWHGASKDIAMTHFVITEADEKGKNVEWMEAVSDEQYNSN
ncbi:(R)-mandelonitrile lyase [Halarcobacter anaerophilus]|jgi:quercetin dioxygenase-like cupin family protein|uniref:(R)-mandelonitrile lyase n=1 Tax=Halarcobacter anaerophilus TaxID=877500 RepID=UPI0005CAE7F2|nr:cupin domain-containing protein [Halarcobacter anaerophilus]